MVRHLVSVMYVFEKLGEPGMGGDAQESAWGEVFSKIHDPRAHSLYVPPLIPYKNQVVSMALEGLLGALEWCPSTGGFVEKLSQRTGLLFSLLELLVHPDFYVAMPVLQSILTLLLEMITLPTTFGRSICDQLNGGNFSLILSFLRSQAPDLASGLLAALAAVPQSTNLEYQLSKKAPSPEDDEDAKQQPLRGLFHLALVDYSLDSFVNVSNTATSASTSSSSLCEFAELGVLRMQLDEKAQQLVAIGIDSTNPSKEYTMEVSIVKEVLEEDEEHDEEDDHDHNSKAGKAANSQEKKSAAVGKKAKKEEHAAEEHDEEEEAQEDEDASTVLVFRIPRPNGKVLLCRGVMLPGRMIGTYKEVNAKASPAEQEAEEGGFYGSLFAWLDSRAYSPELWKAEKQALEMYKRNVVDKKKALKVTNVEGTQIFHMVLMFLQMQWATNHWTRASASEVDSIAMELSRMTELGSGEEIEPHMKDLEVALYRGPNETDALFKKRALLAAHLRMIIAQIQNQLMEAMENELKDDVAVINKNLSTAMQSPTAMNAINYIVRKYRRIVATSPIVDPAGLITPESLLSMYAEMSDPKAKQEREEMKQQMEDEAKQVQKQQQSKKKGDASSQKSAALDQEEEEEEEESDQEEEQSSLSTGTKLLLLASAITAAAAIGAYAFGRWFSKQAKSGASAASSSSARK